jgi:hypothetical protein
MVRTIERDVDVCGINSRKKAAQKCLPKVCVALPISYPYLWCLYKLASNQLVRYVFFFAAEGAHGGGIGRSPKGAGPKARPSSRWTGFFIFDAPFGSADRRAGFLTGGGLRAVSGRIWSVDKAWRKISMLNVFHLAMW